MAKLKKGERNVSYFFAFSAILASFIIMIRGFIWYQDNLYNKILEKDLKQINGVSNYVTNSIHGELYHCISQLQMIEEVFHSSEITDAKDTMEILQSMEAETAFTTLGLIDLSGNITLTSGTFKNETGWDSFRKIETQDYYISNVLIDGTKTFNEILIAVPFRSAGRVAGALCGQYPVSLFSEAVELNDESLRYFQIIDDQGQYISRSNNKHAFSNNLNLWDELHRYNFPNGTSIQSIRENVKNHQSGSFWFSYMDMGRYVTYEPLGINNWYVFSVLAQEEISSYTSEIRTITMTMLLCFTLCVFFIFAMIFFMAHKLLLIIRKKNQELEVKNMLFQMVLGQTKDLPFEIDLKARRFIIYKSAEGNDQYQSLDFLTPQHMRQENLVREDDFDAYKTLFENMMEGKSSEPVVLQLNFNGQWGWYRIHYQKVNGDNLIGFLENYNELNQKEEDLEEISLKSKLDFLTGLYNREAFKKAVDSILKAPAPKDRVNALFLMDLDYFKLVNDTLGHITGDQVLHDTALLLRSLIRKNDLAGRLGGDEFVLFIQNAPDIRMIHQIAKRLNQALERTYEKNGKLVCVSSSIGIALVQQDSTFEKLYEQADQMLYQVKYNGRGNYAIYDPQQSTPAPTSKHLIHETIKADPKNK